MKDSPNGPFKSSLDSLFGSDTAGVTERVLSEYRYKNGELWLYTYSRKYFKNGDYVDNNVSKVFVNASPV